MHEVDAVQQQRVALHLAQARESEADGAGTVRCAAGEHADFSAVETRRLNHGRDLHAERWGGEVKGGRGGGGEGRSRGGGGGQGASGTLWMPLSWNRKSSQT